MARLYLVDSVTGELYSARTVDVAPPPRPNAVELTRIDLPDEVFDPALQVLEWDITNDFVAKTRTFQLQARDLTTIELQQRADNTADDAERDQIRQQVINLRTHRDTIQAKTTKNANDRATLILIRLALQQIKGNVI